MTMPSRRSTRRDRILIALLPLFLLAPIPARSSDASFYLVAKGLVFSQTNTSPPVPKGSPARLSVGLGLTMTNAVTNVTVQALPNGAVNPLVLQVGATDQFNLTAKFADTNALNGLYPDGNYKLVIAALHDGTQTPTLVLNGEAYPSSIPFLNNFEAAQTIDPAKGFTLNWNTFSGGTINDVILVTVSDGLGKGRFSTPDPGQPNCLNGTATSVTIPPNSLPGGVLLGGSIIFAKVVALDKTSYPGVPGFTAYYTQTQFSLGTAGSVLPPSLNVFSSNTAGPFQLVLTGQTGQPYAIDATTNLSAGPWLALFTNTVTTGQLIFIDNQSGSFPLRFYRGRVVN